MTPQGSSTRYNIDPLSGQLYSEQRFCKQRDIYKTYPKDISTPPYTEGIVPRVINQIGRPQRIIVFGNKSYYADRRHINTDRVRVVGGIVEKLCFSGTCKKEKSWLAHMVLVAVDTRDSTFRYVHNMSGLKEKVDWNYVNAFILNGRGRNVIGGKAFPAYKLNGEIQADQAILFVGSHGHEFHVDELKTMQKSCYKLYDYAWKSLAGTKGKQFLTNFRDFTKKFGDRYKTCTRYVKYSNINSDFKRHWFFTYLSAYINLYKIGYYYNCSNGMWGNNPIAPDGSNLYGIYKETLRCKANTIEAAFDRAVFFMRNLQRFEREYYRYISYDDLAFGTHNKLYSFVKVSGKKLGCAEDEFDKYNVSYDIFPEDIRWKKLQDSFESRNNE